MWARAAYLRKRPSAGPLAIDAVARYHPSVHRRGSALAFLFAFAAVLATACGSDAPSAELGGGCSLTSDCTTPAVCVFSRCHEQCDEDRDCPDGTRCVRSGSEGNVCQLSTERDCTRTSDCPTGQVCATDDQCRNACLADKDCTPGEVCADGSCASKDDLDPGGKLPQKAEDGTPCRYNSDCHDPRTCRRHQCVLPCLTDVDCPIEQRCHDHACEPIEAVCIPNQLQACPTCGNRKCDEVGQWGDCHGAGCNEGGGGAGGTGGFSTSGPGAGGSGGAPTTTGSGMTTSVSSTHASSSSSSTTASASSGGGTGPVTSSTTAATTGAGAAGSTGSCMPCLDAGLGGAPFTRNFCCP